ncbi:MAG: hypothetical protein IKW80_02155 [Thermoguttaceae bacterium]|nr:hypothetical protein [Thermoguttaceae bacterium]
MIAKFKNLATTEHNVHYRTLEGDVFGRLWRRLESDGSKSLSLQITLRTTIISIRANNVSSCTFPCRHRLLFSDPG